jgi:hypothetical protein
MTTKSARESLAFVVTTSGRPALLARTLTSLKGLGAPVVVIDDSPDSEGSLATSAAVLVARRAGLDVVDANAAWRDSVRHVLDAECGRQVSEELTRGARCGNASRAGWARNLGLLAVGRRTAVFVDDDVVFGGPSLIRFAPAPYHFRTFESLGRALEEYPDRGGGATMVDLAVRELDASSGTPRASLATFGLLGDLGIDTTAPLVRDTQRWEASSEAAYRAHRAHRQGIVGPTSIVRSRGAGRVACAVAVDCRGETPCFVPYGRGQMASFAQMLLMSKPDAVMATLPHALTHAPADMRIQGEALVTNIVLPTIHDFVTTALSRLRPDQRLRGPGPILEGLADAFDAWSTPDGLASILAPLLDGARKNAAYTRKAAAETRHAVRRDDLRAIAAAIDAKVACASIE